MSTVHAHEPALKVPRIAPDIVPCPRCGAPSPRNEVRALRRHAAALTGPMPVTIRVGCYICPDCPEGARWFRLAPAGFEGRSAYTDSTRAVVVSLVTRYKMSFGLAAELARDVLHLPDLADTTVMRWFREEGDDVDYVGHLRACATAFSGQFAIDEVYDGGCYVIRVTDPLNRIEVTARYGEGSPKKEDVREVLLELRRHGFDPKLIVTDGSDLYPTVIAEVFPAAAHQRCTFHFMQGANDALGKAFWDAYATMPEPKKRGRGRPKKRGRPRADKRKRADRAAVKAARFLVFKRGGLDKDGKARFSERETDALERAMTLCPPLRELRRFVEALHELVGRTTTTHELAEQRRRAILDDERFRNLRGAEGVLRQLADDDLFARLTRYLDFDDADATSNHAERENREFRKRQGSHYRLRSVVSMVAFLDLMLVRRAAPDKPRRLTRREPPTVARSDAEVGTA